MNKNNKLRNFNLFSPIWPTIKLLWKKKETVPTPLTTKKRTNLYSIYEQLLLSVNNDQITAALEWNYFIYKKYGHMRPVFEMAESIQHDITSLKNKIQKNEKIHDVFDKIQNEIIFDFSINTTEHYHNNHETLKNSFISSFVWPYKFTKSIAITIKNKITTSF